VSPAIRSAAGTLEPPLLDDLRFQDLVNDARKRIAYRCREWDEHNVSDPGITLIEQFAAMVEALGYRVDRVPEKLHITLLNMLGVQLEPPKAAVAEVLVRLADPGSADVAIPAGTEVATPAAGVDDPVVFRVSQRFVVPRLSPGALLLTRGGQMVAVPAVGDGWRPSGALRRMFGTPPRVGDAVLMGFDEPLGRLRVRLELIASPAMGIGVAPQRPPLRWEASGDADSWTSAEVVEDGTLGFNTGGAREIVLQLPERVERASVGGHALYWIRCSVAEPGEDRSGAYQRPPEVSSLRVQAVGALVRAEHAVVEVEEPLGISDGTPAQRFRVRHRPALDLDSHETLEVREPGGPWRPWQRVDSFGASEPDDTHFHFDPAAGAVELGPAIHRRDGWRQYGRVPPRGSELRMTIYRHGGGSIGNVSGNRLTLLRKGIAGVASVTNPAPARDGVDAESLTLARRRAAMELRTRYRAVTREDFEFLAEEVEGVARATCLNPPPGKAIPVHLLRAPSTDVRAGYVDPHEFEPDEALTAAVVRLLDERRLLGTSIDVRPMGLREVRVAVDAVPEPFVDGHRVEQAIEAALYRFLSPIVGGEVQREGSGWDPGRALNEGELYAVVHGIDGVSGIRGLAMYERAAGDPAPPRRAGAQLVIGANEVICSGRHAVRCYHDGGGG
jgi:predicted phage baseplate assembly protein